MSNNRFLTILLMSFSSFVFSNPNIVIILADDLGWNDVSFHGSKIPTPNIDRIVKAGIELDRFYVQPTCSPTRAELMTGKSALRLGIISPISKNQKLGLSTKEKILPQYLKELGYKTVLLGKWHLGAYTPEYFPTRRGFDYFYGYLSGGIGYWDHNHGGGHDWQRNEVTLRETGYSTHLLEADAVRIINEHDFNTPLFLNINFNAPHTPNEAPQATVDSFSDLGNTNREFHAAMVFEMDQSIGRILSALEKNGIIENTIIFFASDNGGLTPNPEIKSTFLKLPKTLGLCNLERPIGLKQIEFICSNFDGGSSNEPLQLGKMSVLEGGIRVPAAVWWPNHLENGQTQSFISMVDVLPTILDLAGVDSLEGMSFDGRSQKDVLFGKKTIEESNYVVANIFNDTFAIIDSPYKLIISGEKTELYNIFDDPTERIDISNNEPEITNKLFTAFNNWPKGVDRALSTKDVLLDPDTFGGKEDRLPYVEQAFINAKEQTKSH